MEPVNEEHLKQLVNLLLEKEKKNQGSRNSSKRFNSRIDWEIKCLNFNRQQKCSHLKGGKTKSRWSLKDYAVSFHTLPDGNQRIACLLGCGFEVWNMPEWRFKWQYALDMCKNSSNTPSASEVPAELIKLPPPGHYVNSIEEATFRFENLHPSLRDNTNPIKGRQKATPHRPDTEDLNDSVIV